MTIQDSSENHRLSAVTPLLTGRTPESEEIA